MATIRLKLSPGEGEFSITEEAGAAVNSDTVELTIEQASTAVNVNGTTRKINKAEILDILEKFEAHIIKSSTLA